jgi:hypothetical protein
LSKLFSMDKGLVSKAPVAGLQQGLFQYCLVIVPGAELCQKVVSEKQWLYEQLRHRPSTDPPPNITVASFFANENMEDTIIRYMNRLCSKQYGFQISLNNFSGFPPGSIHLRVQDHFPFKQLANELESINSYITGCGCPPMKLNSHPQVSIANKVPENIYTKALMAYAQRTFHETFTANEFVLLRTKHEYDSPKVVNIFRLQPAKDQLLN